MGGKPYKIGNKNKNSKKRLGFSEIYYQKDYNLFYFESIWSFFQLRVTDKMLINWDKLVEDNA